MDEQADSPGFGTQQRVFNGEALLIHGGVDGGPSDLKPPSEWIEVPVPEATYGRGVGALDMARCIRNGGTPLASGELGYHVLDTMVAIEESIASGRSVQIDSTVEAIPLLPVGWDPHQPTL